MTHIRTSNSRTRRDGSRRFHRILSGALVAATLTLGWAGVARADEPPATPPPDWSGSAGLSYLATTGNTDTTTLGFDFDLKKLPDPWGLEFMATYFKAQDSGDTTAERYGAEIRGNRKLSERWSLFLSGSAGKDRFSGFDFRGVLAGGGNYKMLLGPKLLLDFDLGLTWTTEHRIGAENRDYAGGTAGANFSWVPRKGTSLSQTLAYFADFDTTSNWRFISETAFQSAIAGPFSFKFSYAIRYQNLPVPDHKKTDTTTKAALVISF